MKKLTILSVIVFSISALTAQTIQWRGENRTGIYNDTGLLKSWGESPKLLWHYDGLGEGHSSVAISEDKIYVTGMTDKKGYIYALDKNGKELAKKEYGEEWSASYNGSRGTITIDNGKLYLMSGMGVLYCFDQKSLDLVWKMNVLEDFGSSNIVWGINESPLIAGEKIIVTPGGKENNVVALDKTTGKLIWSSEGKGDLSAYCSPIYISDLEVPQVVTMTEKNIIGVDIKTGKLLWSFENINKYAVHANTPVYGDGMLLCTSGYGKGSVMLKFKDGGRSVEKVWESTELDSRIGGMVKIGDYAYGSGDFNKFWFCVDWKTGDIKYKEKGLPIGVTIAADGMLYCYSDRGDMALAKVSPEKFEIVSRFPITLGTEQHWAHPVISSGVLYVRHGNTLMAYAVK